MPRLLVNQWSQAAIDAECAGAYGAFTTRRRAAYQAYFLANSELADLGHTYLAKDFASALPESSPPEFSQWLPPAARHRHHRSGNSSQMLALGLLGIAARRDPSLEWWWEALDLPGPTSAQPSFEFESSIAKEALGETGGATSVDFLARDESAVICCECKWVEPGIGSCTCKSAGGDPANGTCRQGIYECVAYWQTAADFFALPKYAHRAEPCRLGFAYQAVRNVAAALSLASQSQTAVFVLLYDGENPYFSGHGEWPGWPTVLQHTLDDAHPQLQFRARTWQELVAQLPLDAAARAWASEKHGLD